MNYRWCLKIWTLVILAITSLPAAGQNAPLVGLVVDAARLPEKPSYYHRLFQFCSEWGFNTIFLRLTDDQGSAIKFASHPELITHSTAFTADQIRDIVADASALGIEVIPEIESFGHAGYLTGVPGYSDLADSDPSTGRRTTTLMPLNTRSLSVLADLYAELGQIFPSRYIHVGCDEAVWGGAPSSQALLSDKSRAGVWADHLNALQALAAQNGKEAIVWGDYVLRKEPGILNNLNKGIIIFDWNYYTSDKKSIQQVAQRALGAGFRLIGGPALIWCRWGPRAGQDQLNNIAGFADAYLELTDPNVLGIALTNWVPSRYLQNSIWDGFAFSAVAFVEGSQSAFTQSFRRFVEQHYGSAWTQDWADIFTLYYQLTPERSGACTPPSQLYPLPLPWADQRELADVFSRPLPNDPNFRPLVEKLKIVQPTIQKNLDDFVSFAASVDYLDHLFWRRRALTDFFNGGAITPDNALALITQIAKRDQQILSELTDDWNKGRPEDSPLKRSGAKGYNRYDALLSAFTQAAEFTDTLATTPNKFFDYLPVTGDSPRMPTVTGTDDPK